MMPLSMVEHPATKRYMALMRPDFELPSRRTLGRELKSAVVISIYIFLCLKVAGSLEGKHD